MKPIYCGIFVAALLAGCNESDLQNLGAPSVQATAVQNVATAITPAASVVEEWVGMQGDARHDGYVPVTLDPALFSKAWEWQRSGSTEYALGINPVVTSNGLVYVSTDVYFGEAQLIALNERSGALSWQVSFGTVPALNPPGVRGNTVYIATTGHDETFLWAFDAKTGSYKARSPFAGQWPHVLAPTVYGGQVYTNGGYYGGTIYAFSTSDLSLLGERNKGSALMTTPAVDAKNVYFYSGNSLEIWDRLTGTSVASIEDPFGSASPDDYHGAPILGGRSNVVSFAKDAFSGRASSNVEHYEQRTLSSFNITTKTFEWTSSNAYLTAPAIANGVIYAGRNNPMRLDAIDETTGKLLWSLAPPSRYADREFHRNIIATDNLLFVSTDRAVYAIDLATRLPVWSYPKPGMLALSGRGTLLIATGARESDGGLVAIKLN